jgi:hypothetical protein
MILLKLQTVIFVNRNSVKLAANPNILFDLWFLRWLTFERQVWTSLRELLDLKSLLTSLAT